MIIFISDLHLSDGTFDYLKPGQQEHISHDVSFEAFKLFWDQIWRIYKANKKDNNIKEINVILLGDIFELRSTTQWVASDYDDNGARVKMGDRPWNEKKTRPSQTCEAILERIWEKHEKAFRYLSPKKFSEISKRNGLFYLIKHLGKKNIKIQYVCGNHDRLVHFYNKDYLVDKFIKQKLGWTIPLSDTDRGFVFKDDNLKIISDHGHKDDFMDYYIDYYKPPLGAVLADLFGRLMYHVQIEKNKELICFCMDIDNVRPASDRLVWLAANISKLSDENQEIFKKVLLKGIRELKDDTGELFEFLYPRIETQFKWWMKVVLGFIGIFTDKKKFLKKWIIKLLDKLINRLDKPGHGILKEVFDDIQKLAARFSKKKKKEHQDQDFHYYEKARKESAKGFRYVLYGHSHRYKLIPLSKQEDRKVFYFNTGTWKKTVQRNLFPLDTDNPSFQKWTRITHVNLFDWRNQEVKDHVFDVWHGNLQTKDEV